MTQPARTALLAGAAVASVLAIASAADASGAGTVSSPWLHWLTKPTATALLLLVAWTTREPHARAYRTRLGLGLACSLVGDVLLMLPGDRFVAGLAAFLVAHLCYLAAFSATAAFLRHRAGVVAFTAVATLVLSLVLPAVGGTLRLAIVAYVIVITAMAAQATSWLLDEPGNRAARLAAIGASLFVASDALLAIDRFAVIVPYRDLLVLAPYWLAQACLALSVARPPAPSLRFPTSP